MDRMNTVIATRKTSSNYKAEYKRFIQWVYNNIDDPMLDLEVNDDGRFITRLNVEECYTNEVVHYNGNHNSASRIHQALQWFYKNVENPTGFLVIKSPTVEAALRKQQDFYREKYLAFWY
jgi:hypothetical protein